MKERIRDRLGERGTWWLSDLAHDFWTRWAIVSVLVLGAVGFLAPAMWTAAVLWACALMLRATWLWQRPVDRTTRSPLRGFIDPPIKSSVQFCEDCGSRYVAWRSQDGFNPMTGEPRFVIIAACPQWDEARERAERDNFFTRAVYSGLAEYPAWKYTCGNRATTKPAPSIHLDHPADQPSQTCPGCIEDMVRTDVLSRSEANRLIAMLGFHR